MWTPPPGNFELRGIIAQPLLAVPSTLMHLVRELEPEPEPGRVATKLSIRLEQGAYYPVARAGSLPEALASPRVKRLS